jgi:hypothetical protein
MHEVWRQGLYEKANGLYWEAKIGFVSYSNWNWMDGCVVAAG